MTVLSLAVYLVPGLALAAMGVYLLARLRSLTRDLPRDERPVGVESFVWLGGVACLLAGLTLIAVVAAVLVAVPLN